TSVLQINQSNFNDTITAYEVVFINFYADWCHFSMRLAPIFEQAAVRLAEDLPNSAKVRLGRVDCVSEVELSNACGINKFPTLRLYYHGHPLRREYRAQRSVEALVEYVQKQLKVGLKYFNDMEELEMINVKRRTVIAFFENRKRGELQVFELLAERYKNDCDFYLRIGKRVDEVEYTHSMPTLVFRPDTARTHAVNARFGGDLSNQSMVEAWLLTKCVPLVREVDFNNVEEIIEQRLPLLVLFHMPQDLDSVKDFKSIVEMQLADFNQFNYVTVDGLKFEHSVRHMGKTHRDLPLIAIDSLKLMFPYPKFKDMYIPGHLKEFLKSFCDQHLFPKMRTEPITDKPADPKPLSTFKNLGPSKHRYTLLGHDEL
ncbi:hypothetical protein KR222_005666, partial [Zaprionus bogoriensis]